MIRQFYTLLNALLIPLYFTYPINYLCVLFKTIKTCSKIRWYTEYYISFKIILVIYINIMISEYVLWDNAVLVRLNFANFINNHENILIGILNNNRGENPTCCFKWKITYCSFSRTPCNPRHSKVSWNLWKQEMEFQ